MVVEAGTAKGGKQRTQVEDVEMKDMGTGWYNGPGVQIFPLAPDLHSIFQDPNMRIMRFILGQGKLA
jgi:hypothetical protein